MKPLRIYISGASGLGKTTLAKTIANELAIGYKSTSASQVWDKFGVSSHQEVIQKSNADFTWGFKYQKAILENREEVLFEDNSDLVTDRSVIDNLIYFMSDSIKTKEMADEYNRLCIEHLKRDLNAHRVVFIKLIRPFSWDTEENGKRVSDEFYQIRSNYLFKGFDFRYHMEAVKQYYYERTIELFDNVKVRQIGKAPIVEPIFEATITSKDFKSRVRSVMNILSTLNYITEEQMINVLQRVEKRNYDLKKII